MKLLYKPVGIVMGILAGLIGRQLFNFIWGRFDKEEPPEATTRDSPLPKVLGAAALQGAIFAGCAPGSTAPVPTRSNGSTASGRARPSPTRSSGHPI